MQPFFVIDAPILFIEMYLDVSKSKLIQSKIILEKKTYFFTIFF